MFCCPHCSQLSTILNKIVTPDSGSTILFNIVNWQAWTTWATKHCSILLNSGLSIFKRVHGKKTPRPLLNRIEQCFADHIVHTCQQQPESGVPTLFNIVYNCEQCGQQSIVQSCFHQYCINLSVFTRVPCRESRSADVAAVKAIA
jgi:hypothetical protein